jgi:hypothetical protein
LRIALDDSAAKLLRGETSDVSKMLSASEALAKLLPAAVLASPPPVDNVDPRETMWQTYLGMRRRGELAASYLSPQERLKAARAKVAEIEAELAALAPPPDEPGAGGIVVNLRVGAKAITPPTADIVPPSEIGECYAGIRPGPDDPPAKSTQVIDGKAEQPPRPLRIGEQYSTMAFSSSSVMRMLLRLLPHDYNIRSVILSIQNPSGH